MFQKLKIQTDSINIKIPLYLCVVQCARKIITFKCNINMYSTVHELTIKINHFLIISIIVDFFQSSMRPMNVFVCIEMSVNASLGVIVNLASIVMLLSPIPIGQMIQSFVPCYVFTVFAILRIVHLSTGSCGMAVFKAVMLKVITYVY